MDRATIRKVTGGYVVEVRWPYAGTPLSGGEVVCKTFDEAVTMLARHLDEPWLKIGCVVLCQVVREPSTPTVPVLDATAQEVSR